jgi:hypothetical protein
MPPAEGRAAQVVALGTAQTVAWASSTYLPAILAAPMAAELGLTPAWVFAAFSLALGVMAVLGPAVGRAIDRRGGRGVLCLSNGVLAGGLLLLALAGGTLSMFLGWALIGAGMALGLYDAAFAALVRQHGLAARGPITGITLLGGFASTIGWPLSSYLVAGWNWRVACAAWAASHLLLALPLNYHFMPALGQDSAPSAGAARSAAGAGGDTAIRRRNFVLLAIFGAATAFVTSAMAAHLPLLLRTAGIDSAAAIAAAALLGPAQVVARLGEFIAAHKFRPAPLLTARLATALHPLAGAIFLAATGLPGIAMLFAVLHGAGNGLITIAKGTLPLAIFGAEGYGALQGRLAVAQRVMQALAPFVFALVMARGGAAAGLVLTVTVSLLALAALLLIGKSCDADGNSAGDALSN